MSSWKGKTRGGVLGHKIFIYILKKSGIKAAYALLKIVAAYFIISAPSATINIYKYFRTIHHFSRVNSMSAVYKNFYLFGQTLIDKVAIIAGIENKFTYTFNGENHLKELSKSETGGILISAHLGNWEIAGFMLKNIALKINIVMFEAEQGKIKGYLEKVMKNQSVNIIPIKKDLSHIFLINNALRNKEIICMHGDRYVEGSRVDLANFMGKEAFFPLGPFLIAAKLKVPFTFVYALKGKNFQYHLSATPPIHNPTLEPHEILQSYVSSLETQIKAHPLQWFNYYDFWSKDVKGGIFETSDYEKRTA